MSFLAPLYLLGLAAVAAPVLLHLRRRASREQLPFSSLMFLTASPPHARRRRRLDRWLLLLLRAGVLAALALAFSRPWLNDDSPATRAGLQRTLVLVDTSASLRRDSMWSEAVGRIDRHLRDLSPTEELGIYTFDRRVRPLLSFHESRRLDPSARLALAQRRLAAIRPGHSATWLGPALLDAAGVLDRAQAERPADTRRIILVSDLQEGSRLDSLDEAAWPDDLPVLVDRIDPATAGNAGLHPVSGGDDPGGSGPVRVRVANASDSTGEKFEVRWSDSPSLPAVSILVPPGESRIVRLPERNPGIPGQVVLSGDSHPFDNTVFLKSDEPHLVRIAYAGPGTDDNPNQLLYYLRRAFPPTRHRRVEFTILDGEWLPGTSIDIVVLAGPPPFGSLERFLEAGGLVLVVAQPGMTAEDLLPPAGGSPTGTPLGEAEVDQFSLLADIDFDHPLFSPLADGPWSDFTRVHIWRHRQLTGRLPETAAIIARFDDGSPAIAEWRHGAGRVMVFAFGWHPADSELSRSTRFVPLLDALLDTITGRVTRRVELAVGDELPVDPRQATAAAVAVELPDRSLVRLASAETRFDGTVIPGVYTLTAGERTRQFSVNLDPAESRTAPLARGRLAAFGIPLAEHAAASSTAAGSRLRQRRVRELEGRQRLWQWVLLGVVAMVLTESWLAGRGTPAHFPGDHRVES